MFGVQITGVKEIDDLLGTVEPKLQKKVERRSARRALKPVLAAAKELAPVESGALRDSFKIKPGKYRRDRITFTVSTGEGWFKGDEFYAGFVILGTKHQPPHPFLQHAADTKEAEVIAIFTQEVKDFFDKEVR